MKNKHISIILVVGLILMATTVRVVNAQMHLYNLAPLAALGLFSGAIIKDMKYAFIVALAAQFCADLYFQVFTSTPGFYGISQIFTYAALIAATFLGTRMNKVNTLNTVVYTFCASTLFFLISNLGVWAAGFWGAGTQGLVTTYIMGIPFFKYTIMGDMAGSIVLFGGYFLLEKALTGKMQKAHI